MEQRKADNKKGKSLDEMIAFIDENGNISDTPPDYSKAPVINAEDIPVNGIQAAHKPVSNTRKGRITFLNEEKGYGFISDMKSQQRVFVHVTNFAEPLKEGADVLFETEPGLKGEQAVNVRSRTQSA